MEYRCRVCGLHYASKKLAEECLSWCSSHSSCNLAVSRQSVEAVRMRKAR